MKEPCKACDGTGEIDLGRCIETIKGRQCKNRQRNAPVYYRQYPDRAWVKPYCAMHGNLQLRWEIQRASAAHGDREGGEG